MFKSCFLKLNYYICVRKHKIMNYYNNKIGFLPAFLSSLPVGDVVKTASGFFSGIFGGGDQKRGSGYCFYAGNDDCYTDNGNWTNSKDLPDNNYLPGGKEYNSVNTNQWGGVFLQILRAANNDIVPDNRIKQAINDVLSDYNKNNNGQPNYHVLTSSGDRAKSIFYNYINKYYPEALEKFYRYVGKPQNLQTTTNNVLPQVLNIQQGTPISQQPQQKNNTLLYVGIGAAVLLGGILLLRRKK